MLKKISALSALWALALICLASFLLTLWASRTDSAITDELAHIPAGYGYVHNLDYRLNPEHPPLVKALAMFPVLFLGPTFPTQSDAWQTQVNAQWDMGSRFLYQVGNDANSIIQLARFGPMFLMLLVVILTYFLARGLLGNWWALLPATLFALSPTALAHGHYVTTDIGTAFGVILATYYFLKFIEAPSTKYLWYAGLAFGVAQVMKFSTPLLVPLFVFLTLIFWLRSTIVEWAVTARRAKTFFIKLCKHAWRLILIFVIGYAVIVYPIYFLFTVNYPVQKQVSDTSFILQSFANGPTAQGAHCKALRCLADLDIWMSGNRVLRPVAEYMLGILMVIQRSDGGNTIYYMGEVRNTGGPSYFPLLFLLKEPTPTLMIVLFALVLALWWMIKRAVAARGQIKKQVIDYLGVNFAEFSMASFIVLYWGYSMRSPLNIGFRHLIPTIPFIYILAAGVWKKWVTKINFSFSEISFGSLAALAKPFLNSAIKYIFLVFLIVWLFIETLFAAPYFLSYFNEFGGGTSNGYRYVTDSNYDWGQDLLRLQSWVAAHPEVDKIAVDYFGGGNPGYYLGDKEVNWWSSLGNPADKGIHWFAISINQLEGFTQPLAGGLYRKTEDSYLWLTARRPAKQGMGIVPSPDYRAGTSIFIYHL